MDYRERFQLKEYRHERRQDRRVWMLHAGILAVLVFFLLSFFYLQVVRGEEYARLAENNRLRRVALLPSRGVIVDRNDSVIASTRPSLNLVLLREDMKDPEGQLQRLSPILDIPVAELMERFDEMRFRPLFEPLVLREDVRLEELARIESRRELFPDVEVRQVARRSYVDGSATAHALGYVGEVGMDQLTGRDGSTGLQMGDIVGKSGIERTYDEWLRGKRGFSLVSVNSLGREIGRPQVALPPVHGRQLALTLDMRLQKRLVEALGDNAGSGVFLDPNTGEILALASSPAFDAAEFADGISREAWTEIQENPSRPLHNRAIASYYAPGSTFKVLMAVAGLETGIADPSFRTYCNGSLRIHGSTRLCWRRGGHGWVDLHEALTYSCNVYFYKLGEKLGIDPIHQYGSRFRLGKATGVELPGEASGLLPSREWKQRVQGEIWYPGDTISVAIGQGLLAITPIQMAVMMSAVGTGGNLPHPHLTAGNFRTPGRVEISDSTLDLVRSALREVVEKGTGRSAALPGIPVAGKTGTAQVVKRSAGIDSGKLPEKERDHAWFVGYAPADRPEIAFAVVVEHGGHGGATAAPVARQVLEEFFADRMTEDQRRRAEARDATEKAAG
jgi:penicillin-binding protein 2